jgi:hypothetical protein
VRLECNCFPYTCRGCSTLTQALESADEVYSLRVQGWFAVGLLTGRISGVPPTHVGVIRPRKGLRILFFSFPCVCRGGSASLGLDGFGSIGFPYTRRGGSLFRSRCCCVGLWLPYSCRGYSSRTALIGAPYLGFPCVCRGILLPHQTG